jgi:hypothetical protein
MNGTFRDTFDALLALQTALEGRMASDWMRDATASMGPFPPINVFQQGADFVWKSRQKKTQFGFPEVAKKDETTVPTRLFVLCPTESSGPGTAMGIYGRPRAQPAAVGH